ncbi:hypothetical protein J1605_002415 [Eschrichtius robustus]|uniref:Uncharacterized protein n=1 Tax=Eschrichtius robustus TaxID=9764 RepID=A0AB34HTU8_ESCRO|nr:hypothetical protein J1605_002415 [Eschrichtius robustus]
MVKALSARLGCVVLKGPESGRGVHNTTGSDHRDQDPLNVDPEHPGALPLRSRIPAGAEKRGTRRGLNSQTPRLENPALSTAEPRRRASPGYLVTPLLAAPHNSRRGPFPAWAPPLNRAPPHGRGRCRYGAPPCGQTPPTARPPDFRDTPECALCPFPLAAR